MNIPTLLSFNWRPSNPDQVLKQAAEKMNLFTKPVPQALPTVIIPKILKARPLVKPPVFTPPTVPAITFPLPTPLATPPVPVQVPVIPIETSNGLFAAVIPAAKAAIDVLTLNRRITVGLFFLGLFGITYFSKETKFRNIDISVEADPKQKRTYDIKWGKDNRTTTIQLILMPGRPIEMKINRPKASEPTVYNIEIISAGSGKKERVEVIDLGHKQAMRVVDRRPSES